MMILLFQHILEIYSFFLGLALSQEIIIFYKLSSVTNKRNLLKKLIVTWNNLSSVADQCTLHWEVKGEWTSV